MNPSPSVTSFMDGPKDQDPLPAIEEIKETLQALKEIKELLQEFPTQLEAAKICKSQRRKNPHCAGGTCWQIIHFWTATFPISSPLLPPFFPLFS
ncbi:hypothetical protein AVEN_271460-1 [Araneus ventricosus]|uniref:Uncharacterized protein n=1 Tax=Araneus ventricosus TaxID=182803 RepID=A0A4Y2T986_ARAVE|nr:hypothetical protein AVEN_271460-1 [Araneus ventricosus]